MNDPQGTHRKDSVSEQQGRPHWVPLNPNRIVKEGSMSDNTSRWSSPDAPAGGARDNSEETVVSTGVDSPTETLESARSGATREMPPQIQPTGGPQPPAPPSAQTAGSSQQMPGWGVHQERSAPAAPQVVSNGAASSPWISEGSAPARARSSSQTAVRAKRGPGWAALFVTMVANADRKSVV